jgi:hypothetical protein
MLSSPLPLPATSPLSPLPPLPPPLHLKSKGKTLPVVAGGRIQSFNSKCSETTPPESPISLAAEHTAHLYSANRYNTTFTAQFTRTIIVTLLCCSYLFLSSFSLLAPDGPCASAAMSHVARSDLWQVTFSTQKQNYKHVIHLQAVCALRAALDVETENWRLWVNLMLLLLQVAMTIIVVIFIKVDITVIIIIMIINSIIITITLLIIIFNSTPRLGLAGP